MANQHEEETRPLRQHIAKKHYSSLYVIFDFGGAAALFFA
jgi:hypothetical protein